MTVKETQSGKRQPDTSHKQRGLVLDYCLQFSVDECSLWIFVDIIELIILFANITSEIDIDHPAEKSLMNMGDGKYIKQQSSKRTNSYYQPNRNMLCELAKDEETLTDILCQYKSVRFISVKNKKVATVYYILITVVLAYIIGYTIIYDKCYQVQDDVNSVTSVRIKGSGAIVSSNGFPLILWI